MEGRLRGDVTHPDYDFLDTRLNAYHALLDKAVAYWVHNDGVSHQINWAWDELKTVERLVPGLVDVPQYTRDLTRLTADSNELVFRLVEESSLAFEAGDERGPDLGYARSASAAVHDRLLDLRNAFVRENAGTLLEAISVSQIRGPVMAPQIH